MLYIYRCHLTVTIIRSGASSETGQGAYWLRPSDRRDASTLKMCRILKLVKRDMRMLYSRFIQQDELLKDVKGKVTDMLLGRLDLTPLKSTSQLTPEIFASRTREFTAFQPVPQRSGAAAPFRSLFLQNRVTSFPPGTLTERKCLELEVKKKRGDSSGQRSAGANPSEERGKLRRRYCSRPSPFVQRRRRRRAAPSGGNCAPPLCANGANPGVVRAAAALMTDNCLIDCGGCGEVLTGKGVQGRGGGACAGSQLPSARGSRGGLIRLKCVVGAQFQHRLPLPAPPLRPSERRKTGDKSLPTGTRWSSQMCDVFNAATY
ncbi:Protein of unknown function [Gryllus bimaculatus]|nr:Protein of unknown function [Gryllus bimaculatus]